MSVITARSQERSTNWLLPAFMFFAGCAVATGILMPTTLTNDYQRGHSDGYSNGWDDAYKDWKAELEQIRCEHQLTNARN